MNNKKKLSWVLLSIMCSFLQAQNSQSRNTMWLGGFNATSKGYALNVEDYWQNKGYNLVDLPTSSISPTTNYIPALGVTGATSNLENLIEGRKNVLGIAHDYGGLILRNLATGNNTLTGIILDGVPNQGSAGVSFALGNPISGSPSNLQLVLDGVDAIKSGESCEDCDFLDLVEDWADEISDNSDIYSEMAANSNIVNQLNLPENLPSIPYVVFYGTVDNSQHSLTNLMSSYFFTNTGNGDQVTKCYVDALERQRDDANKETITLIDNVTGFLHETVNFVGDAIAGGALNVIQEAAMFVNNIRGDILTAIETVQERDEELARILRCELANQYVMTEWQLALLNNQNFEVETISFVADYDYCYQMCSEIGYEDWEFNFICMPDCIGTTQSYDVIVAEENDLILTKSEQRLPGHVREYHLPNTNHFQETDFGWGNLDAHMEDIFDGAAGPAFVVPKN